MKPGVVIIVINVPLTVYLSDLSVSVIRFLMTLTWPLSLCMLKKSGAGYLPTISYCSLPCQINPL